MINDLLKELGLEFNKQYKFKDETWTLMPYNNWFVLVPINIDEEVIRPSDAKNALRILLKLTPIKRVVGTLTCKDLDCDVCPFRVLDCEIFEAVGVSEDEPLNVMWDKLKKECSIDELIEQSLKKEI